MRVTMKFLSRLLLLWVMLAGLPSLATAQVRYAVDAASRFWIEGSATTGPFTCETDAVAGSGHTTASPPSTEVALSVPVATFDCGNRRMNADLQEAMKMDEHPLIQYALDSVRTVAGADTLYRLQATGVLTIAGVARPISVALEGQELADGQVQATGRVPLKMTDFGITPPTALLGLVRVRDDIHVRFHLLATVSPWATTHSERKP